MSTYTGKEERLNYHIDAEGILEPLVILPARGRCHLATVRFGHLYCPHSDGCRSTVHENMVAFLDLGMLEEHLPSGKSSGSNTSSLH